MVEGPTTSNDKNLMKITLALTFNIFDIAACRRIYYNVLLNLVHLDEHKILLNRCFIQHFICGYPSR